MRRAKDLRLTDPAVRGYKPHLLPEKADPVSSWPGSRPPSVNRRNRTYRDNIKGINDLSKRVDLKYKIDRRLGVNLWGRPKSPINKRNYGPGQHGQRRKKPSDYGVQLMAKQKLKGYYGNIGERQFRRLYEEASRRRGDTSENLVGLLERRLDAVVYRAKFASILLLLGSSSAMDISRSMAAG